MTETFSFGIEPITCHAWSPDGKSIAISLNSREIQILTRSGPKASDQWTLVHTLTEHTDRVLSLDWGKTTNRILSAGADRNAFVWTFVDGEWRPMLVVLRLGRAATCVKWSPLENKFAVGSGAKLVAVCYYDKEQDFWVAKHIKKNIRSTVTSLDWHPNNILIAAGCTDFRATMFSGFVKEIEEKPAPTVWGARMPFGNEMDSFSNGGGGWVHAVAFNPSGTKLAWVGHDSSVSVVDASNDRQMCTVKTKELPFLRCLWVTDNSLLTAGHDNCPMLFKHDAAKGAVIFVERLDVPKSEGAASQGAMKMFQNMDRRGQSDEASSKVTTIHQNTVTGLSVVSSGDSCSASVSRVSTTGKDGQLVLWNLKSLEASIAQLTIA